MPLVSRKFVDISTFARKEGHLIRTCQTSSVSPGNDGNHSMGSTKDERRRVEIVLTSAEAVNVSRDNWYAVATPHQKKKGRNTSIFKTS